MKLRKVISGGQTGADRTGLECAKALGLETGGTVPKGWRTEAGADPTLAEFGCVEHASSAYPPRTKCNVVDSDATVWFGRSSSPGGLATKRCCDQAGKPFIDNPLSLQNIADTFEVINVAGNRQSVNWIIVDIVRRAFATLEQK